MSKHSNLSAAKDARFDELYTNLNEIENELKYYKSQFKDKVVYCNCDDGTWSEFWHFFHLNFKEYGLKKLIATHYDKNDTTYKMEWDGSGDEMDLMNCIITPLDGNGDFRSDECISILKDADIVVTNPPFSIIDEYIRQLMEYNKKFLIIGPLNALKYKEVFPWMVNGLFWIGCTTPKKFRHPDGTVQSFGNILWYTNMPNNNTINKITAWKKYTPEEFPKYDNFDAIEVNPFANIPADYDGVMGVPISAFNKCNHDQFEIVGELNNGSDNEYDFAKAMLNGRQKYARLLIRWRKNS